MTAKEIAKDDMRRYRLVWVRCLVERMPRKSAEKAVAELVRDGEAVGFPFDGRTKVYGLSRRTARALGEDPRHYGKPPGIQAIVEVLLIYRACLASRRKLMTAREFTAKFPHLAAARGVCRTRYYLDFRAEQPRVGVFVPDHGASYHRVAKRGVRAISKRKEHEPFRTFIYNGLFVVTVLTAFEPKAQRIRAALAARSLPCPVEVEVVPGVEHLILGGSDHDE